MRTVVAAVIEHQGKLLACPASRAAAVFYVNLLGFQIFLDAPGAEFATETGLLVATPGSFDVCGLHVIDPHDAGAQGFTMRNALKISRDQTAAARP